MIPPAASPEPLHIPAATPPGAPHPVLPSSVADLQSAGNRGFDFRHLWHLVLEKIWIVVFCVLAGLFLALGYLARTPKVYQGHITLEVDIAEQSIVPTDDAGTRVRSMFLASQEALRTIEQNLVNRSLLARVIRSEGLAEDGGAALLSGKAGSAAPPPRPATAGNRGEEAKEPPFSPVEEGLAGALGGMVKPVVRRGTRLIDLYVTNRDPVMSQRLAEAVGREFIRNSIERRASSTEDTLRYLLEEEERLKNNLKKSEAAVAEYKANTPDALQLGGGAAATGSQVGAGAGGSGGRGGLVEDKLQDLNTKLMGSRTERLRLESELKQIDAAGQEVDALLSVPSIANAPAVTDRRRELAQVQATVAALSQRYKDRHPKMVAARAALAETQAALSRVVLDQPAVLRNAIGQAQATENNFQAATQDQEKAALALNKAAIGYQELARQAETDRALYESVLRQIKSTDLSKGVKTNAVSVVERSPTPSMPIRPNPKRSIALGLLGGLAAGLGAIFGMNAIDRTLKTVDQVENILGLPVLAAVPDVKKDESQPQQKRSRSTAGTASYRLVAEAPEGPAAEAFRNLRAGLSLLGPEAERRVFLFTSALPGEGKSFTSANYSLSLAQQGYRVLLIDGDLRRPSLHKIFLPATPVDGHNPQAAPGIVDQLIGSVTLQEAAHAVSADEVDIIGTEVSDFTKSRTARGGELSVLAGGTRAPNPAELLSGTGFSELVAEATRLYDRVVIDSAPILAVSDTLLMTPYVQSVCVVIRARHTVRNAVQRALAMIATTGIRPAGVILNRLPRSRGAGYYYYYASHGYGAGEGSYTPRPAEQKRRA